jgi:N-6 DNA methylase
VHITKSWIFDFFSSSSDTGKNILRIITEILNHPRVDEKTGENFTKSFVEQWKKAFSQTYLPEELDLDLFASHNLLVFVISFVLYLKTQSQTNKKKIKIDFHIITQISNKLILPSYFAWIFKNHELNKIFTNLFVELQDSSFVLDDFFSEIYQDLIANTTRHPKGEFYTESALAEIMVQDIYEIGMKSLDPSCGSGTFLLEMIKKINSSQKSIPEKEHAIKNLYGFDINPIACIMARGNLLLSTGNISDYVPPIEEIDSLFIKDKKYLKKFDLVIGNPPWLVLNRIHSKKEQVRIKKLGNSYGILQGGKLATSTELTTIFCYKAINEFLNEKGQIFFVTPASLATAAQHELFRQFKGLKNIEFWAFDNDVFRIHNICFKGQIGETTFEKRTQVIWKLFHCTTNPLEVKLQSTEIYIPSIVRTKKTAKSKTSENDTENKYSNTTPNPSVFVGRLISKQTEQIKQQKSQIIEFNTDHSLYKKEFLQGASIIPRNLVFVDLFNKSNEKCYLTPQIAKKSTDSIYTITPSDTIQSKKYSTWDFEAFKHSKVESKYLYSVAKSTGMIPFLYIRPYQVFLPIEFQEDGSVQMKRPSKPLARKHYDFLEDLYTKHKKKGASVETLISRLNYGHALTDPRQQKIPKIIYAGIGSIVKGAIINEPLFIDTSLYHFSPSSLEETYFLLGYLNSPSLTMHVKLVGSTGANGSLRNIHKHPFNFGVPKFDDCNEFHLEISHIAQNIEEYVKNFYQNIVREQPNIKYKLKSIQNRLFKDIKFKDWLKKLDKKIMEIMILEDNS